MSKVGNYGLINLTERRIIISTPPSPYETIFFFENYKKFISLICTILGYDGDGTMVDIS